MNRTLALVVLTASLAARLTGAEANTLTAAEKSSGWQLLFDGKSLNGWKANEDPTVFTVSDGNLVVSGKRSHLFYTGPVAAANFKNFELTLEIMTFPKANSGVYFHTAYQDSGWPAQGYEVQVNNSHTDAKRGAGLYAVQDNATAPAKDGEWYTMRIKVEGRRVQTFVNDKQFVDYTQEDKPERRADMSGRLLSSGTFALQGHDPESKVMYRNIKVRVLPD